MKNKIAVLGGDQHCIGFADAEHDDIDDALFAGQLTEQLIDIWRCYSGRYIGCVLGTCGGCAGQNKDQN